MVNISGSSFEIGDSPEMKFTEPQLLQSALVTDVEPNADLQPSPDHCCIGVTFAMIIE